MPGILYHLSFAEEVYRKLNTFMPLNKVLFMAGNLIPDLATDKELSHYRIKASVDGFYVPEMESVKKICLLMKIRLNLECFVICIWIIISLKNSCFQNLFGTLRIIK